MRRSTERLGRPKKPESFYDIEADEDEIDENEDIEDIDTDFDWSDTQDSQWSTVKLNDDEDDNNNEDDFTFDEDDNVEYNFNDIEDTDELDEMDDFDKLADDLETDDPYITEEENLHNSKEDKDQSDSIDVDDFDDDSYLEDDEEDDGEWSSFSEDDMPSYKYEDSYLDEDEDEDDEDDEDDDKPNEPEESDRSEQSEDELNELEDEEDELDEQEDTEYTDNEENAEDENDTNELNELDDTDELEDTDVENEEIEPDQHDSSDDENNDEEEPDLPEPTKIETKTQKPDTKLSAESIEEFLNLDKSKYTIERGFVKFTEINVQKKMNDARKDTKTGLVKSIREVGILTPIHVMITKEYGEFLKSKDKSEPYKAPKYILLDGYRRVFNGIKVGLDGCYATIWNFKDKYYGEQFALILSAILNKTQKHSMNETWELIKAIRQMIPIGNRTLDSLFQLENGDTSKLLEIMTSDYQEVIDAVMNGKKTISQAYNQLKKLWDEEDEGARDDKIGVSDFDTEHKVVGKEKGEEEEEEQEERPVLTNEQASEILNANQDDLTDEEVLDTYKEMIKEPPVKHQDPKDRKQLDKDIKAETLRRDGYKCTCCGSGEGLPLKYALTILQSHHIISVANGGPDSLENITTVCPNCHTLIHTVLWNEGIFNKSDFEKLPPERKEQMKKILKYAYADYKAAKLLGKTTEQIKEDNKNHIKFKMPGTDLRENKAALAEEGIDLDEEQKRLDNEASKVEKQNKEEKTEEQPKEELVDKPVE